MLSVYALFYFIFLASDTMSSLSLPSLTPSHGEEIVDGAESDRDPGSALSWFERFDQPPCCGINKCN